MIKTTLKNPLLLFVTHFFGTLALTGLVTMILRFFEAVLDVQYVALLYLLPVMVSAALWGLTPGILARIRSKSFGSGGRWQPLTHRNRRLVRQSV